MDRLRVGSTCLLQDLTPLISNTEGTRPAAHHPNPGQQHTLLSQIDLWMFRLLAKREQATYVPPKSWSLDASPSRIAFTSHSVAEERNWQSSEQHWPLQSPPPSLHHDGPREHRALGTSLHWLGSQQGLSSSQSSPGSKTPLPQVGSYGWIGAGRTAMVSEESTNQLSRTK